MGSIATFSDDDLERVILTNACRDFLYTEARYLDSQQLDAWLDLLTEDVRYRAPVRVTREKFSEDFSDDSYHFFDDRSSLETRVERVSTEYDWSEDPPGRTCRYVTNVHLGDVTAEEAEVRNNLLLHLQREQSTEHTFLAAHRHDRLRATEDGLKLAERDIYLGHTTLGVDRLSFLL